MNKKIAVNRVLFKNTLHFSKELIWNLSHDEANQSTLKVEIEKSKDS